MSTPHMTGRRDADKSDRRSLDASDFLDENGKVDESKIKSISNRAANRPDRVTGDEVDTIRRRLLDGASQRELADELGRCEGSINAHARGKIEIIPDPQPTVPALAHGKGGWYIAGESVWVASPSQIYHSDDDCPRIRNNVSEWSRELAESWDKTECEICRDGPQGCTASGSSLAHKLEQADPEDLGLSSNNDRARVELWFVTWWLLVIGIVSASAVALYLGGAIA